MSLSPRFSGRVAQSSGLFFPVPKLWVPRPCVFGKGGYLCCRYHGICHAQRLASHLRRASPALYHLLLLSTIAISEPSPQPRLLPFHSRTGAPAIPIRGGWLRRYAGTYSLARHRARDREPLKGHAGSQAAHGSRVASPAQAEGPATRQPLWRGISAQGRPGKHVSTISTSGPQKSEWRSCGTCIGIRSNADWWSRRSSGDGAVIVSIFSTKPERCE